MMAVLVSTDAYRCEECESPWLVVWSPSDAALAWVYDRHGDGASRGDALRATLRSAARSHAATHEPALEVRKAA